MNEENNHTWIASYPRSGNGWIRFIVTSIVYGNKLEHVNKTSVNGELFRKTHLKKTDDNKAIYLTRNPVDVYKSFKGYYYKFYNKNVTVNDFINKNKFGRWDDHVIDWLETNPLIIRYEDMIHDIGTTIERIERYINVFKPMDLILPFVSLESMKMMQEHAIENKIVCLFYNPKKMKKYEQGIRLLGTKMDITENDAEIIKNEFGVVMKQMGYGIT